VAWPLCYHGRPRAPAAIGHSKAMMFDITEEQFKAMQASAKANIEQRRSSTSSLPVADAL
jgi:hypothetical protein